MKLSLLVVKVRNYEDLFLIGDQELWSAENSKPQEFSEASVYARDPCWVAEAGSIRGLQVDQKYQVTIDNIKDNNLILQFFHGRSEVLVITLSSFDFEPGAF